MRKNIDWVGMRHRVTDANVERDRQRDGRRRGSEGERERGVERSEGEAQKRGRKKESKGKEREGNNQRETVRDRQADTHILTQTDRQASVNTYHKFLKLRIELIFICWHGNVHSDWFQWGVIVGAKLDLGWTPATQAPAQPPSTRHLGRVLLTPVP